MEKGYTVKVMANGRTIDGDPVRYYESKETAKIVADRLRRCGYKASLLQKGKKFTVWYKKPTDEVSELVIESEGKIWKLKSEELELLKASVVTTDISKWFKDEKVTFVIDEKEVSRKIYDNKEVGLCTYIKGIQICYVEISMRKINKYSVEQFERKFSGKRRISCGVNFENGKHDTFMNASCSQILSYIRQNVEKVLYIVCCQ